MSAEGVPAPLDGSELIMRECKHMCLRTIADRQCCVCLGAKDRCVACTNVQKPSA